MPVEELAAKGRFLVGVAGAVVFTSLATPQDAVRDGQRREPLRYDYLKVDACKWPADPTLAAAQLFNWELITLAKHRVWGVPAASIDWVCLSPSEFVTGMLAVARC